MWEPDLCMWRACVYVSRCLCRSRSESLCACVSFFFFRKGHLHVIKPTHFGHSEIIIKLFLQFLFFSLFFDHVLRLLYLRYLHSVKLMSPHHRHMTWLCIFTLLWFFFWSVWSLPRNFKCHKILNLSQLESKRTQRDDVLFVVFCFCFFFLPFFKWILIKFTQIFQGSRGALRFKSFGRTSSERRVFRFSELPRQVNIWCSREKAAVLWWNLNFGGSIRSLFKGGLPWMVLELLRTQYARGPLQGPLWERRYWESFRKVSANEVGRAGRLRVFRFFFCVWIFFYECWLELDYRIGICFWKRNWWIGDDLLNLNDALNRTGLSIDQKHLVIGHFVYNIVPACILFWNYFNWLLGTDTIRQRSLAPTSLNRFRIVWLSQSGVSNTHRTKSIKRIGQAM